MALTKKTLSERKIGGSKISTIMGQNKYRSRIEQYKLDIGETEEEDLSNNYHVICGNKIEEPLRRVLVSRGFNIELRKDQFFHKDFDFYSANIDGYDGETVVELKSALNFLMDKSFGPEGTDEIPLSYNYQVQWYMLSPEYRKARLHAIFLTDEMKQMIAYTDQSMEQLINICEYHPIRTYYIEPDLFLQDNAISEAEYYWNCVQNNTMPKMLDSRDVLSAYLNSNGKAVPLGDEELRILSEMDIAKKEKKSIEKQINVCKDKLSVFFGENEIGTYNGKKVCSYKTQESKRVDTQKLKDDNLYDKYLKVSVNRVLRG